MGEILTRKNDPTYYENTFSFPISEELNMYYCGKRIKTPHHSYGPEIRTYFLIIFIKEGTGTLHSTPEEIHLNPGHIFVMFPNEKIHYTVDKDSLWTISWVGVYGKFAYEIFNKIGVTPKNPVFKISNFEKISDLFEELYMHSFSENLNDKIHIVSLLYRLFSEFIPDNDSNKKINYVLEATNIIDYNYDKNITVEDIAKKLYINPCYLSRMFKEEKNISIKQYLTEKRISRAKQMLETENIPINIIAASVGIYDSLYFSRLFKKYTGFSPKKYVHEKKKSNLSSQPTEKYPII